MAHWRTMVMAFAGALLLEKEVLPYKYALDGDYGGGETAYIDKGSLEH